MALRFLLLINLVVSAGAPSIDEKLSRLEVGDITYTNVSVLSVTATDIYFTHSGGVANAKLTTLKPAIQKRFHFDPEKAWAEEALQHQSNALYQQMLTNAPQIETRTNAPPDLVITAEAAPPAVEYEYYKMNQRRPPQLGTRTIATTIYNFECFPEFTWLPTPTKAGEGFKWRLVVIKLSLSLPIKITLPEGVTSTVRAHEEGHRRISEHRDLYSPRYLGYDWKRHRECDYEDYLIHRKGKFDWDGPIAIFPPQKNPRMRSQHGWFTIFGKSIQPMETQLPKIVRKVDIPKVAIPAAKQFLLEAGIDSGSVFPDLDGFAAYLKEHYRIT
jgi:hypothetical protein